jgi:hypothetical protein
MEPHIAQKSPYASPVEAGKASRRQAFMWWAHKAVA